MSFIYSPRFLLGHVEIACFKGRVIHCSTKGSALKPCMHILLVDEEKACSHF